MFQQIPSKRLVSEPKLNFLIQLDGKVLESRCEVLLKIKLASSLF